MDIKAGPPRHLVPVGTAPQAQNLGDKMEESSPDIMLDPPSHRIEFNPSASKEIINSKEDNPDSPKRADREEEKI